MDQIAITDGDAVEAFINAQDDARQQACAVFIASRVALRMAPVAIEFFEFDDHARKRYLTSVMIWRALLTSGVASTMPTPDVRTSAAAASCASSAATDAAASRASSFFADDAVWAEVTRDAALWLGHADQGDGTLSISIAPLWSDENPLDQDWHSLREKLRAADTPDERGADWSFWIKWYDDILAGNPQNWKMLHEIATTPDIDWDASSREVNDKINGIVTLYRLDEAIKNHALDRKVVFNAQSNRLVSEDIEVRDLKDIVKSLRSALRRFVSRVTQDHVGNKMGAYVHAACERWIKRFRAEINKNKVSTSDLAHCLRMNQLELQQIIKNEGLEQNLDLNRLFNELAEVDNQIMVAAPEVWESRKATNRVQIDLNETEYLIAAKRMTHGMMLDSGGSLEKVMAWVLYTLDDTS
jgi:hypothetical protein